MSELQVVEICAGAGGQSLGLARAGFEHALAVELDESAASTLRHNLDRMDHGRADVRVGDVADPEVWKPVDFAEPDLLAGGVPCPPFSVAGKQLGSADERDLFAWAVELAGQMQPKALLLENVRGLSTPRFSGYRQAIADRLEELGYWSEWKLLHASDFAVPQLRPRFVLVALHHEYAGHFDWPDPDPAVTTVGDALRDLMGANGWKYSDKWADLAQDIGPTIVGGSKKHGGADLGPTRARAGWAKLHVDGRGVADEAPSRAEVSFRTKMPRLTNEMVARVQGWGNPGYEWEFLGRKTSVYRQIGNAFPPPVAEAVGTSIARALRKEGVARDVVPNSVAHDEVYKLLRAADGTLTESAIAAKLGLSTDEVSRRINILERDFALVVAGATGDREVALGPFRAFRGQADHHRHEAFAERRRRSRVS